MGEKRKVCFGKFLKVFSGRVGKIETNYEQPLAKLWTDVNYKSQSSLSRHV